MKGATAVGKMRPVELLDSKPVGKNTISVKCNKTEYAWT